MFLMFPEKNLLSPSVCLSTSPIASNAFGNLLKVMNFGRKSDATTNWDLEKMDNLSKLTKAGKQSVGDFSLKKRPILGPQKASNFLDLPNIVKDVRTKEHCKTVGLQKVRHTRTHTSFNCKDAAQDNQHSTSKLTENLWLQLKYPRSQEKTPIWKIPSTRTWKQKRCYEPRLTVV